MGPAEGLVEAADSLVRDLAEVLATALPQPRRHRVAGYQLKARPTGHTRHREATCVHTIRMADRCTTSIRGTRMTGFARTHTTTMAATSISVTGFLYPLFTNDNY